MMSVSDLQYCIAVVQGRYRHPLSLAPHNSRLYSQNGEDGIIAEIFRRIGTRDRYFVEIGTQNGLENNTRFLLEQGWQGVWIDGDLGDARELFADFVGTGGSLRLIESTVTVENVNSLFDDVRVPTTFDFLSIDIDQNTSHVWRALNRRARVACIEYNASIPASVALEVAYDPASQWDGTNWIGGSLKALEQIGASKAMSLVGCDLTGLNAFFVARREARRRFQKPFTAEQHWEPARYGPSEPLNPGHRPSPTPRRWHQEFFRSGGSGWRG